MNIIFKPVFLCQRQQVLDTKIFKDINGAVRYE